MNSSKVKFNANQSSQQPKINSSNNNNNNNHNNNNNNNNNNTSKYHYNNRNKRSIKSNARFKNKSKHNNNIKNKEEVTKLLDLNSTNDLITTSSIFINATVNTSTTTSAASSLSTVATTSTTSSLVNTKIITNEDASSASHNTICNSESNSASILPSVTSVTSTITMTVVDTSSSSLPATMTTTIPSAAAATSTTTITTTTTTTPNSSTKTQTTNVPLNTLAVITPTSTSSPMVVEEDTAPPSSNGSIIVSATTNKQPTNVKPTVRTAVKRSASNGERSSSHQIPRKKLKNGINGNTTNNVQVPQPKNTVAMLNELRQGLIYNLESQSGPVHAPIFTMTVEVDGQIYNGQGRSKKIARIQAAAAALRSFIQFKDGAVLSPLKPVNNVDFTSDEHIDNGIVPPKINKLVELMQNKIVQIKTNTFSKIQKNLINKDGQKQVPEKGPVMLLYELFNDVHIECASNDGAQHSRFKMIATVNDQKFEGTGPSKKLAKNAAAKAALAALCDISYSPMQAAQQQNEDIPRNDFNKKDSYELPQTFADAIGKLVLDKFSEVTIGIENYSRRKVLAGIVMIYKNDLQKARVISVSTGTKCINGEHMSVNGAVINDSHAEIVSRRCLVDYLYTQLEMLKDFATAKDSIFRRSNDGNYLYKLADGIRFHLYINTAPCGDARIFSPHEDDMGVDKHPNRKARGQLRTKIESGEGTIPVKSSDGIQTWDGVLQGQRLLTMSCSDKIARWNVLGLQGALLSTMIHPIYLESIVLGSLLHPAHMYRAVCGRIESAIQGLPPPFCLNKPKFALVTSAETRNQIKAPNFGINWTIGLKEVEVVNSLTGKTVNGKISRLSKQTFYNRYAQIFHKLPYINCFKRRYMLCEYGAQKLVSTNYQTAKQELFAAFRREGLGDWLKKPMEQDQFYPKDQLSPE